jgi:hypothetical protein
MRVEKRFFHDNLPPAAYAKISAPWNATGRGASAMWVLRARPVELPRHQGSNSTHRRMKLRAQVARSLPSSSNVSILSANFSRSEIWCRPISPLPLKKEPHRSGAEIAKLAVGKNEARQREESKNYLPRRVSVSLRSSALDVGSVNRRPSSFWALASSAGNPVEGASC